MTVRIQRVLTTALFFSALAVASAARAQYPVEVLHEFDGFANLPSAFLQASDGNFYGLTTSGGTFDRGTIFRLTPAGQFTVIHTFTGGADGAGGGDLLQGRDGRLYGVGGGILFRVTLDGAFTVLHSFTFTEGFPSGLKLGADGNFYGTAFVAFATFRILSIYRATPDGVVTWLRGFGGEFGIDPSGLGFPSDLVPASDGNLYGTITGPTVPGSRAYFAFRITSSGTFTLLRQLEYERGPRFLAQGPDGYLYGVDDCGGTFFKMSLSGADQSRLAQTGVHCSDSPTPSATLTRGTDGIFLYGTISRQPRHQVIRLTPNGLLTVLGTFPPSVSNVGGVDTVLQASDGNLYIKAFAGGSRQSGAIYRLNHRVPLSPGSVIATPAPGGMTLRWNSSPDATGYIIRLLVPGQAPVIVARTATATSVTLTLDLPSAAVSYVVTAINAAGESLTSPPMNPSAAAVISRTPLTTTVRDYDGDGKADLTVVRRHTVEWFTLRSGDNGVTKGAYGFSGISDRPVPADYDGDGKADVAVFLENGIGVWLIHQSSDGANVSLRWGASASHGDLPIPADYDGDGRADLAVFRTTTGEWFVLRSSDGTAQHVGWGAPELGDLPVPADYDGDGRADIAVYRSTTGEWFVQPSSTGGLLQVSWGAAALVDVPVPADYDGDGRTDVAVYRATTGEWFIAGTAAGFIHFSWGTPAFGDVPIPADYDGDGRVDPAIYRVQSGEWFIVESGVGRIIGWGAPLLDTVRPF